MKTPSLILFLMRPLFSAALAADESSLLLQKALFEEEANHDLDAAVKAYQAVVADADAQRKLAATAVFRLGECYRKLGRTNDAVVQYQRIVSQFGDQTNLLTLSRQNLTALGAVKSMGETSRNLTPAEAEANRLLIERLKLELQVMEADVQRQQNLIEEKIVSNAGGSLQAAQARVLELRRQLILAQDSVPAVDGASAVARPIPDVSPSARAQLKELLEGEIEVAERLAAEQRRKILVGTAAPGEELRFEREVLGLKRQLLAVHGLKTIEDRKKWREMLLEEIALAEKAVQFERQRLDKGKSVPSELAKLQRDVFALKRELVTFDAAPAGGTGAAVSREGAATDEEEKEVRRIQALIKDSPDLVNAKNVELGTYLDRVRYGTPLHRAAQQGQLVVARFLIDNHADLDWRDDYGRTPLHWAAVSGHRSMAELLLSKGADPNASISGRWDRGSAGQTPLHLAAQNGYRNVCETLLAGKADINARDSNGATPLHFAAERGFPSVAELLLTRGADVNSRNSNGNTPLHSAAGSGAKQVVELLLAHKADPSIQNAQGGTPLYAAVFGKHADVVRLLLANKANPNLALNEKSQNVGATPLAVAIQQGDLSMTQMLLENGANANMPISRGGWTPLMEAATKGSLELVTALIAAGADVNARIESEPPLNALYSVTSQNPTNAAAVVKVLLANKADANVADASGSTPLMLATLKRNLEVVKLLLEHGADLNAMNRQGQSALSLIKPTDRQPRLGGLNASPSSDKTLADSTLEIISLLEQHGAQGDLQRLFAISTSRNQENRMRCFFKGTNDWNRYTLMELIAWINPRGNVNAHLAFPDLSRISIGRIDSKTAKTQDIHVDLAPVLASGDCTKDVPLQWGDVVEIPEQDHFVNAVWKGYPDAYYQTLQKCLARTVRVTVKGQSTNVVLTPFQLSIAPMAPGSNPWELRMAYFRLNHFLRNSGLLLTSSDLTRVKVRRTDPATKQVRERVFNLDQIQKTFPGLSAGHLNDDKDDLWLRDGDEIEVPEKDPNAAPPKE